MKMGYEWIAGASEQTEWWPWMENRWIYRKHRFVIWLLAHKRLLTRDRMKHLNMTMNGSCFFCDDDLETVNHLFSRCIYSRSIYTGIGNWGGIMRLAEENIRWWLRLRERAATKKKVVGITLATCIYALWQVRNVAMHDFVVPLQENVVRRIKNDVIRRLESLEFKTECMNTKKWSESLKM